MADAEFRLTQLLTKIADEQLISNADITIKPTSSGGANYTSKLFLATINNETTELKLFAKVAVVGEKMRNQTPMLLFETENAFYTKLANIYKNLQSQHNVRDEDRFSPPEFYGCNDKTLEEILVLEDLVGQGYNTYDRLKSIDWDYATAAVEELAKFHALSFAFKEEDPEKFENIVEQFKYTWKTNNRDYWEGTMEIALNAVKPENKDKLKNFFEWLDVTKLIEFYTISRGMVLSHGDNRVSNQMYRKDADGRVHVRLVDYQTLQGASPVIDLLYFIFTSSDEEFRAKYYEKLLDHYYEQLSLGMKRFGLNPQEIYSKADFDFEYNQKLPYGLSIAVFTLPVVTVAIENAPKVTRDMDISCFKIEKTSELFVDRLNGIVNDFIRWGVM